MEKVVKTSEIVIQVGLNEEQVPVDIKWRSDDNPDFSELQDSKAMILALFDRQNKETLRIDLWTKDMQIEEMDRFFFQSLKAMADTYYKATQNSKLASEMQRFVHFFGEQTEIIPKSEG